MAATRARIRRLSPTVFPVGVLLAVLGPTSPAGAQSVRVAAEQEVFRQTADGRRLATVMRHTEMRLSGREGAWSQVRLEGWIWAGSVNETNRGGFDLVVSVPGGENLRDAPGGRIAARLLQGFLLEEVERGGEWIRVARLGWIWGPSLAPLSPGAASEPGAATPPATGAPEPTGTREEPPAERVVVGDASLQLRLSPRGDTTASLRSGAVLRVVERRDGWARVQVEGWVSGAELENAEPDSAMADLSASDLHANPEQHVGRHVRWSVQFIALERAEAIRTDFYEGEPFLLARAPDPSDGFVYLAVPPELLPRVETLEGLDRIEVLARVRTGRSALMGVPILDLLTLY